ncbi:uncharacterized protein PODANS_1_22375 [Podospora anserina S mat+]|uniref:Podospora anserina S mat+ genomic DNA chromosome 1, supercontig 6 n=1 Tax=Podospora anserina (strain S / ATCC MYA-4624 / DSM 980 / FGSC 10383) TaxID=515849 RepID=B2AS54_PODAN|nr:uncharacterized protein PODANS_1_22375 [Podospora anserina S mat+]CAP67227.1 unnamed protein product [Podospora anserina S mat+]CDP24638.1 Putative protein of unknown function [Podospora anserina S mat+]
MTPPPVVGLVHNQAAATSLSIVVAMTIGIRQVTQNNVILSFRTTEESNMRIILSCSYKHRKIGQAYRGCHRPPVRGGSTFSKTSVIVYVDDVATTNGKKDCCPIVGSNARQGKDEDVVRPLRGKRHKINTSALTKRLKDHY